jgi:predicted amidohydrolase
MKSTHDVPRLTRREAGKTAGKLLTGLAGLTAMTEAVFAVATTPSASAQDRAPGPATDAGQRLRVASCQFPVSGDPEANARQIRDFLRQAKATGAHLLHTSEAALSGYAGVDFPSFESYDWEVLRRETAWLRNLARELQLWLVLGSAHFLDAQLKPTNCLYLINPDGQIADRYDKCFCTGNPNSGDQRHYSAGNRLVTRDICGVRIGLAICYDICWPQLYIGYRETGTTVMLHSFHNARAKGPNCLDVLNVHQATTRCADNRMWAVCNNSSQPYSHWGSFVARPDATVLKQLPKNESGLLVHDFPDGLSEGGWFHNFQPMRKREDEIMTWGAATNHPRQTNGQAEP